MKYDMDEIRRMVGTDRFELVPHVVPVAVQVVSTAMGLGEAAMNYQIRLQPSKDSFLLKRIVTKECFEYLRLLRGTTLYYESPGWLHYDRGLEYFMFPPLFFMPMDASWMLDISWRQFRHPEITQLEACLIGERVVKS